MRSDSEIKTEQKILQLRAVVQGRVQGVGYRQFVLNEAVRLGLTGWVCNDQLDRQRVELEAQGSQTDLEELLKKLWQGPFAARVSEIATQWSAVYQPFDRFIIK